MGETQRSALFRETVYTKERKEGYSGVLRIGCVNKSESDISRAYSVKYRKMENCRRGYSYIWEVTACTILRSGDIEKSPVPFGDRSEEEEISEG